MLCKVNISVNQKTVNVPNYEFLKEGLNLRTKLLLKTLMKTMVSQMQRYITNLLQTPDDLQSIRAMREQIEFQIACLAFTMKEYPELSVFVVSYELEDEYNFPKDYAEVIPKWSSSGTFLSFFLKYVYYFFPAAGIFFPGNLISKEQVPIFIEYDGEPLLLSSYNELLIFCGIIKVLEETLNSPQDLLRTIYSIATWETLSQLSFYLLSLPIESSQKSFKPQITNSLYLLCTKALKVYQTNTLSKGSLDEDTWILYSFINRLAYSETSIRLEKYLSLLTADRKKLTKPERIFKSYISSKTNHGFLSVVLKDECHQGSTLSILKECYNVHELFQLPSPIEGKYNDMKGYVPYSGSISLEKLLCNN